MRKVRDRVRDERGVALVAAILVLVFLSLLATALIVNMTVETKIAGRTGRTDRALNSAEAGIAEAMERIRKGDIPDNGNPKMVSQIFLVQPGSVPILGTDSIPLPTWQEPGNWLSYSETKPGPNVLTVTYKTDAARTKIYRYDSTKNPAIQFATGRPIFVVKSYGRVGDARRNIVTEVFEDDIDTFVKGAITVKKKIHIAKDSWLCGYNHRIDTPTWIDVPSGRNGSATSCNDDLSKQLWELGSDDINGAWAGGKIDKVSNGKQYGLPNPYLQSQSGFYAGAWEVLGMTQAEFLQLLGSPVKKPNKITGTIDGIRYYDADGKQGKAGGHVEFKNVEGEGLLYVEGDIHTKGDFIYRGLVYCTGKITFDGRVWVLGAVVAGKDAHLHVKDKECAILYSHDAIAAGINEYGGKFVTLSWREMP